MSITIEDVHAGKKLLPLNTVVEIMAGQDEFWYGEINGYNDKDPLVTYIECDEDGIYSFQADSFEAPRESVNSFYLITNKKSKRMAWTHLGFSYRGRTEIVSLDDLDSEDSDDEWVPGSEGEEEKGEEEYEEDEEEEEEEEDDEDEEDEEEDDDEEEEDEDEEEDEEEDEDEEEEDEVPVSKKRLKKN